MSARSARFPRTASLLWLALACVLLGGCGFHLRGSGGTTSLPEEWFSLFLVTDNPNSELIRELRARFAANGVQWAGTPEQANFQLRIGPERFSQRNLSINAEARAAEFELTLAARFSVNDSTGAQVMEDTEARVVRQMENDPRNVVGKAEEIRILRSEMRADLSQQIMRRIGFFAASIR